MKLTKYIITIGAGVALCVMLAGCPSPSPTPGPDVKPDGFDGLSDKTLAVMRKARAGVDVASERLDANDVPGAKKALDVTKPLLPAAVASDLDWFRKLCDPAAPVADIAKAKAENAALLAEVQALRTKVANGISPEEVARRVKQAKDDEAARNAKLWRNRILYTLCGFVAAFGVGFIAAGVYFERRRLIALGIALFPCSALVGAIPSFLDSVAFQRVQNAVTYSLGIAIIAGILYGLYEVVKWLRSAKASRVAQVAAVAVKTAV